MYALIIEDDGLIAFYLEALLGGLGYTSCTWATTEDEAIAAARTRCPDLVTVDLRLRAGDGQSAVRAMSGRCRTAPVIYVTAHPDELDATVPPACVVCKPFDGLMLQRAIEAARAMSRSSAEVNREPPVEE